MIRDGNPALSLTRREFATHAVALGAGTLLHRLAPGPLSALPPVSVTDFGARGDGVTDDTDAFSRAIASLPAAGGIVVVPPGTYQIDPRRSVNLRDNMTLQMAARAELRAIPVAVPESAVVRIASRHTQIQGGSIRGEREGHLGSGGEWGMGIELRSAVDVVIDGVRIRDCWGDGIYIGARRGTPGESRNVIIRNCTVERNRRQGLSLTAAIDVLVEDSSFSRTTGTAPESGIDLEPNAPSQVRNVTITRCTVNGNRGRGIILSGAAVTEVVIEDCHCSDNVHEGILMAGASTVDIHGSIVTGNGSAGISLARAVRRATIARNVVRGNSRSAARKYDNIFLAASSNNRIEANEFASPSNEPRTTHCDIHVSEAGCLANTLVRNHLSATDGICDHGTSTSIIR